MQITINSPRVVDVDPEKLAEYARLARQRLGFPKTHALHMSDLLTQAGVQGDIELPAQWEVGLNTWTWPLYVDLLCEMTDQDIEILASSGLRPTPLEADDE
ncbi:MAG: hypothetical protein IPO08_23705 [Xanthomonadales bacterium]|nr:hypothetical protein [Xanthomonadales bacterium]